MRRKLDWLTALSFLVRGKLAVDSVSATAQAGIKQVSRPRPQKSEISGVSEIKDFR
jgi:hypothetical protein